MIDIDKIENLPSREKMHHKGSFCWEDKLFYRHFQRFLIARIGRHIDRVFSEFVKAEWVPVRYRNIVKFKELVEYDVFERDGEIYLYQRFNHDAVNIKDAWRDTFYVNPHNKNLEYSKRTRIDYKAARQKELDKKLKILGDYHQLYKMRGIWYEVKAEPRAAWTIGAEQKGPQDILLESDWSFGSRFTNKSWVKITMIRQLNKKELKNHNVRNENLTNFKKCVVCGSFNCQQSHYEQQPKFT
jgi:hypothetical protein